MRGHFVEAVVAGHICIDIIPGLNAGQTRAEDIFLPGRLISIGPATVSLGGAVANAGLALHRLGFATRLIGKVGDDLLGQTITAFLRRTDPALAEHLVVTEGDASSYTIVLNPPGIDRCFLHCSGANDTFRADECPLEVATAGRVFHFGYPPIMHAIYADGGVGLAELMHSVGKAGVVTSLDMAFPDPESAAGRVDWEAWLRTVLPYVDVFLPSFDEVLLMLDAPRYNQLCSVAKGGNPASFADAALLSDLGQRLMDLGATVLGLKLGDEGFYLRTAEDLSALATRDKWPDFPWSAWSGQELLAPCFEVVVRGTTGSGDCTAAGFLAALLSGHLPALAATRGVAVGACNVESPDATSGVVAWEEVEKRLESGWPRRRGSITLKGWQWVESEQVWRNEVNSR